MADTIISTQYVTGIVKEVATTFRDYLIGRGITTVTQADIEEQLIRFKEGQTNTPLVLSGVAPDYEQILAQLLSELTRREGVWREINIAGGGRALIDFISAVGAMLQLSIERGLQEVQGLDTAQAPSSIYIMTRMLGVHVLRKRPAKVLCTLNNSESSSAIVIPKLSAFSIDGVKFFNREQITFPQGTASLTNVPLYQGEVLTAIEQSNGQSLQKFELGSEDFSTADEDIYCYVGSQNEEYMRTTEGLFTFSASARVFYENTLPNGNVEVIFGTGAYGYKPEGSSEIRFKYVQTLGEKGNKAASNRSVQTLSYPNITGVTTSNIENGADEQDHEWYRVMAPNLFAARGRWVTREDYKAGALLYTGVIDAVFTGQQEIAPSSVQHMNYVQAHLITKTVWSVDEQKAFIKYLDQRGIGHVNIGVLAATAIPIVVNAEVYCQSGIDLEAAKNHLINKIRNEFVPKLGTLGRPRFLSDLYSLLKDARFKVDYVKIIAPSTDYIVNGTSYVTLDLDTLNIDTKYTTRNFGVVD